MVGEAKWSISAGSVQSNNLDLLHNAFVAQSAVVLFLSFCVQFLFVFSVISLRQKNYFRVCCIHLGICSCVGKSVRNDRRDVFRTDGHAQAVDQCVSCDGLEAGSRLLLFFGFSASFYSYFLICIGQTYNDALRSVWPRRRCIAAPMVVTK